MKSPILEPNLLRLLVLLAAIVYLVSSSIILQSATTYSPTYPAAAVKEPPSQQAVRLLTDGVLSTVEPGDNIFETTLMDPFCRYSRTDYGQVKAYRPVLFRRLRTAAGMSEESYLQSLEADNLSCLSSDSKSGQAFWVSSDGAVVVKTIKHYECKNLCRILDSYANHMLSGSSCISSILGLYRVKTRNGINRYFLASKNVYPASNGGNIVIKRFDLKGSTVGRKAVASSSVMKDLDLIASGESLSLGIAARPLVLKCLERDANFLMSHGFMDYSLLVAVESIDGYLKTQRFGWFSASDEPQDRHSFYHDINQLDGEDGDLLGLADDEDKRYEGNDDDYHAGVSIVDRMAWERKEKEDVHAAGHDAKISLLEKDKGKLVVLGSDGLTYHFGVIDFLQKYTFRKWMETWLKGIINDAKKISCVAPTLYAARMLSFIAKFTC